jgi:hypothetical protein
MDQAGYEDMKPENIIANGLSRLPRVSQRTPWFTHCQVGDYLKMT